MFPFINIRLLIIFSIVITLSSLQSETVELDHEKRILLSRNKNIQSTQIQVSKQINTRRSTNFSSTQKVSYSKAVDESLDILRSTSLIKRDMQSKSPSIVANILYFIPTGEGLVSQIRRADLIWNIANAVRRKVYGVDFKSAHFSSLPVSLCNIFDMPKNYTCLSDILELEVFNKVKCVSPDPSHYKDFPSTVDNTKDFDYFKVQCVAGGLLRGDGHYPTITNRFPVVMTGTIFKEQYLLFLPRLLEVLEINRNAGYMVFHWRRNDNKKRCDNEIQKEQNKVNCETVQDFTKKLLRLKYKYVKRNDTIIYVSTDEGKLSHLLYLEKNNIKTFVKNIVNNPNENDVHSIGYYLKRISKNPKLDTFVFELMLQVDAGYYLAWGLSSVHQFVCEIRVLNTPHHATIIDDKRITDYLLCNGSL